jgi:hypothetical protein
MPDWAGFCQTRYCESASSLRAKDRNVPVCLNLRWASVAFLPVREKLCPPWLYFLKNPDLR